MVVPYSGLDNVLLMIIVRKRLGGGKERGADNDALCARHKGVDQILPGGHSARPPEPERPRWP